MRSEHVNVGDVYEWQPYGTDGWPRAHEVVTVVRITYPDPDSPDGLFDVQSTDELCDDDDAEQILIWSRGQIKRANRGICWNELPHFLAMTRRMEGKS